MKIHLASYGQARHLIEETLDPKEFELDASIFSNPIQVKISLDRHDPYLDCKFFLSANVTLTCDRCLEPFEMDVETESPMLYVLGKAPSGDDVDDSDVLYIPAQTMDIDISHEIRDLLILALPEQRLCSETCFGLCPSCGANRNTEPCSCEVFIA